METFCTWITEYIASYLEDATDAAHTGSFNQPETLLLGAYGPSMLLNILDQFLKLERDDQEAVIETLHSASFASSAPAEEPFQPFFVPTAPAEETL